MSDRNKYRCYLCGADSDGLLCDRCRREIDGGDLDRVTKLASPEEQRRQERKEKP